LEAERFQSSKVFLLCRKGQNTKDPGIRIQKTRK
jgi:hypothetical protein